MMPGACWYGHVDCMEAPSKARYDKEATANKGCTGLMFAAAKGKLAVVQVLQIGFKVLERGWVRVSKFCY